jgi:hypothetical protein
MVSGISRTFPALRTVVEANEGAVKAERISSEFDGAAMILGGCQAMAGAPFRTAME